jgi:hypothetical protein
MDPLRSRFWFSRTLFAREPERELRRISTSQAAHPSGTSLDILRCGIGEKQGTFNRSERQFQKIRTLEGTFSIKEYDTDPELL